MKNAFTKLLKVKSIVTLILIIGLALLMTGVFHPAQEVLDLFKTVMVSVITYYFAKSTDKEVE